VEVDDILPGEQWDVLAKSTSLWQALLLRNPKGDIHSRFTSEYTHLIIK
jgi:hypothetical protein